MTTTNEANELTAQLWRQRELLELLLFKYEEERLLSAAGKSRWSAHAAREVDVVIQRLSACSLSTAVAISGLGEAWGLPRGSLLRDLAENAPSPMWQDVFSEHLEAMVGLICEIRDLRAETAPTYGATGAADHTEQSARLIDTML